MRSLYESTKAIMEISEEIGLMEEFVNLHLDEISDEIIERSTDSDLSEDSFDEHFDHAVYSLIDSLEENKVLNWAKAKFAKLKKPKVQSASLNEPDAPQVFRLHPDRKQPTILRQHPDRIRPSSVVPEATKKQVQKRVVLGHAARKSTLDKLRSDGVDLSELLKTHSLHFRKDPRGHVNVIAHNRANGKFNGRLSSGSYGIGHVEVNDGKVGSAVLYRGEKDESGGETETSKFLSAKGI